ncbi:MAG TPA: hypothetical protein VJ729_16600 [Nitrososphaeraceae archaeon]|nr:hypothetical protein [Nitrososphaeraceae archaeon]
MFPSDIFDIDDDFDPEMEIDEFEVKAQASGIYEAQEREIIITCKACEQVMIIVPERYYPYPPPEFCKYCLCYAQL